MHSLKLRGITEGFYDDWCCRLLHCETVTIEARINMLMSVVFGIKYKLGNMD